MYVFIFLNPYALFWPVTVLKHSFLIRQSGLQAPTHTEHNARVEKER